MIGPVPGCGVNPLAKAAPLARACPCRWPRSPLARAKTAKGSRAVPRSTLSPLGSSHKPTCYPCLRERGSPLAPFARACPCRWPRSLLARAKTAKGSCAVPRSRETLWAFLHKPIGYSCPRGRGSPFGPLRERPVRVADRDSCRLARRLRRGPARSREVRETLWAFLHKPIGYSCLRGRGSPLAPFARACPCRWPRSLPARAKAAKGSCAVPRSTRSPLGSSHKPTCYPCLRGRGSPLAPLARACPCRWPRSLPARAKPAVVDTLMEEVILHWHAE